MNRREFIATAAVAGAAIAASRPTHGFIQQSFDVEEATITSLQSAMAGGKVTSRSITQAYLARIADIDKKLNSVIELNPDALAIADAMDAERKAGKASRAAARNSDPDQRQHRHCRQDENNGGQPRAWWTLRRRSRMRSSSSSSVMPVR